MYSERTLNEYTNLCYALLFKNVNEKNILTFYNIDIDNEKCLAVLNIANILTTVQDTVIQVRLPLFKFWKLKKKTNLKNLIRVKEANGIDCINFIKEFEWKNNMPGILLDIYNEFYKRGK
jgi:hypothetical protein